MNGESGFCSMFVFYLLFVIVIFLEHAVAQLVEALRYKSEGCGFDPRWYHWNFSVIYSFRPQYVPGVNSAFDRNE